MAPERCHSEERVQSRNIWTSPTHRCQCPRPFVTFKLAKARIAVMDDKLRDGPTLVSYPPFGEFLTRVHSKKGKIPLIYYQYREHLTLSEASCSTSTTRSLFRGSIAVHLLSGLNRVFCPQKAEGARLAKRQEAARKEARQRAKEAAKSSTTASPIP